MANEVLVKSGTPIAVTCTIAGLITSATSGARQSAKIDLGATRAQTMLVRLYNFSGQAYEPEEYVAVRSQVGRATGRETQEIIEVRRWATYDEALAFLSGAGSDWRLVSADPLVSAVPLTALQQFTPVYESEAETFMQAQLLPEVRVYRYAGAQS